MSDRVSMMGVGPVGDGGVGMPTFERGFVVVGMSQISHKNTGSDNQLAVAWCGGVLHSLICTPSSHTTRHITTPDALQKAPLDCAVPLLLSLLHTPAHQSHPHSHLLLY